MWSIGEVKRKGWQSLKKYYWYGVLVSFLAGLLGDTGSQDGGLEQFFSRILGKEVEAWTLPGLVTSFLTLCGFASALVFFPARYFGEPLHHVSFWGVAILVGALASLATNLLICGPVRVGRCRFYSESRALGTSAGVGRLFWGFRCGSYWNVAKTMFMRELFIFFWTLLLIIPGIYKSYEYAMVPYILAEEPDMPWRDALVLSRKMMDGNRFHLFVTELSFLGWRILGALCLGLGGYFVTPYCQATEAEIYAQLRGRLEAEFRGAGALL